MIDKFINKKAKELAKELHIEEHRIINKEEIDEEHGFYDWYYVMAAGIYQNLADKLDFMSSNLNRIDNDLHEFGQAIKELSKQQKYLWQTLDELKEKLK